MNTSNNLFTQLYGFKYCNLIQVCVQLNGFLYSYPVLSIYN